MTTVWQDDAKLQGQTSITYNDSSTTYNQANINYNGQQATTWTNDQKS